MIDFVTRFQKKRASIRNNIKSFFPLFSVDEQNKLLSVLSNNNHEEILRFFQEKFNDYDELEYTKEDMEELENELEYTKEELEEIKEDREELENEIEKLKDKLKEKGE